MRGNFGVGKFIFVYRIRIVLLTAQWNEECFQNVTWKTESSVLTL